MRTIGLIALSLVCCQPTPQPNPAPPPGPSIAEQCTQALAPFKDRISVLELRQGADPGTFVTDLQASCEETLGAGAPLPDVNAALTQLETMPADGGPSK